MKISKIVPLPADKDLQVDITIKEMISLCHRKKNSFAIRYLARMAGDYHRDTAEKARLLCRLVERKMIFYFDPDEIELLREPDYLAMQIISGIRPPGDCDDFCLLLGTLLLSQQIPFGFVVISTDPKIPEFRHVYCLARIGKRDYPLDPSTVYQSWKPFPGQRKKIYWA